MDNLDLNLDNYSLNDLLNLFGISNNLHEEELKQARRVALKTHPDKSNLDKSIFIFFSKAYNMLLGMYNFKNKTKKKVENVIYNSEDIDYVERNSTLLQKKLRGKSKDDFNSWFNKMFDKCSEDETTQGYGDWLKSNEDVMNIKAKNMNEFNEIFKKKKSDTRQLILKQDIHEKLYGSSNLATSMLDKSEDVEYSSGIFSKLKYEDLKKAHVETVVPVTEEDFHNKKQFANIDQYIRYREKNKAGVISLEESNSILSNRKNENESLSSQRAYNMLVQDQRTEKRNNLWWHNLKQLE